MKWYGFEGEICLRESVGVIVPITISSVSAPEDEDEDPDGLGWRTCSWVMNKSL